MAKKFNDHIGIDWSEIVIQHKEFVGHTAASIRHTFHKVRHSAQRNNKERKHDVSLQEVADYAAEAYQPGKGRESTFKVVRREKIILHFKEKLSFSNT